MSDARRRRATPEEYLAAERVAEFRSEYYDGEVFAMAGGSASHTRIVRNLTASLHGLLDGSPCEVLSPDMLVLTLSSKFYAYPDVVVVCGAPEFASHRPDVLLNPKLLIEVLSPSTEAYDRKVKLRNYQLIPSLREYVLVSQEEPFIERYLRQPDESWNLFSFAGMESELKLTSLDSALPFSRIYRDVDFNAAD